MGIAAPTPSGNIAALYFFCFCKSLTRKEPEEPLLGQSPQTSVTMTHRRAEPQPPTTSSPARVKLHGRGAGIAWLSPMAAYAASSAISTAALALWQTTVGPVYLVQPEAALKRRAAPMGDVSPRQKGSTTPGQPCLSQGTLPVGHPLMHPAARATGATPAAACRLSASSVGSGS